MTPDEHRVTLGKVLRAARARFCYVGELEAFLRVSVAAPGRYRFDYLTADRVPAVLGGHQARDATSYAVWYAPDADPETRAVVQAVAKAALGPVRLRSVAFSLFVNDDGERVA